MPHKLIIIFLILCLAGAYVAWDLVRVPPQISPLKTNETDSDQFAPNPVFTSLDGKAHALHDFKGKVILLNFWATWCAPCIVEFPELLKLTALHKDDIVLIALSVDENPENIEPFLKKHKLSTKPKNVIIGHDPGKKISQDLFQTVRYPETFIIGPDLTIQNKIAGLTEWTGNDITNLIEELSVKQP